MTGFSQNWLALREPADIAARNRALIDALKNHQRKSAEADVLDIGCGTGSTYRSLQLHLPSSTSWRLLDSDPALLAEARRLCGENGRLSFIHHDLNDVAGLPLKDGAFVTASALFDLCSRSFCEELAARLSNVRCGLYAALNYDGVVHWSLPHQLDTQMVDAFNRHQRTDKGFGRALGPDATACLREILVTLGFRVEIGESPWIMDSSMRDLQIAFLQGFRAPVLEISGLPEAQIEEWIADRISAIDHPESTCKVGHLDLLALPD